MPCLLILASLSPNAFGVEVRAFVAQELEFHSTEIFESTKVFNKNGESSAEFAFREDGFEMEAFIAEEEAFTPAFSATISTDTWSRIDLSLVQRPAESSEYAGFNEAYFNPYGTQRSWERFDHILPPGEYGFGFWVSMDFWGRKRL